MLNSIRAVTLVGALVCSTAASAGSYQFSYTMLDNTAISGSFDGTANGNLVGDISKLAITVNGVAMPGSGNLFTYAIDPSAPAHISFDGLATSLFAADADLFSGNPTAYFLIGALASNMTDTVNYNIPGLPFNGEGDGDYSAARWSLTAVSAVPEPATYAMLLGGLALLGTVARRRAYKAG